MERTSWMCTNKLVLQLHTLAQWADRHSWYVRWFYNDCVFAFVVEALFIYFGFNLIELLTHFYLYFSSTCRFSRISAEDLDMQRLIDSRHILRLKRLRPLLLAMTLVVRIVFVICKFWIYAEFLPEYILLRLLCIGCICWCYHMG